MTKICDICGDRYIPIERTIAYDVPPRFCPVTINDRVQIKLVGDDGVYIHSFDACPECSRKVLAYVRSLKGEKFLP